jgi:hypothetical protein
MGAGQSVNEISSVRQLEKRLPELERWKRSAMMRIPTSGPRDEGEFDVQHFLSEMRHLEHIWENVERYSVGRLLTQWRWTEEALEKATDALTYKTPPYAPAAGGWRQPNDLVGM